MGLTYTKAVTVPAIPGTRTFSGKTVTGEWPGGAYVDLRFGWSEPIEVINVYDYATGTIDERVHTPNGLRAIVREWVADTFAEWPEYYEGYMENARY